jgi:sterol desaturase/sphingolipid hydroxylase (fatty acid hydroxylase superfamily)
MQKSVQERNAQGEWVPAVPLKLAPTFVWPIKPAALLRYLFGYPGYFLPWGVFYMAFPIVTWMFFTPPLEDFKSFSIATALYVFVRNLILVTLVAGGFHYWHYVRRGQGTDYKYNGRWLAEDTPRFLFRNQTLDNVFWTVASAVPVWTAFELVTMWGCANGYLPYVSFSDHPIYCILIFLAVPILHEVHFYLTHRLIHIPVLYRTVHYLHHRNVNIGPFSGLAMHPVEHVIYWTGVIFHWIVPSHPVAALFQMQLAALAPSKGHSGFDRTVLPDGTELGHGNFFHYLHHKHFECNYGGDGKVPLDRWFGTFHDGTPEATAAMKARRQIE